MLAYIALHSVIVLIESEKLPPDFFIVDAVAPADSFFFICLTDADISAVGDAVGIAVPPLKAEALPAIECIGDGKVSDTRYVNAFYTELLVKTLCRLYHDAAPFL